MHLVQDLGGFVGAVGGFAGGERALKEFVETGVCDVLCWCAVVDVDWSEWVCWWREGAEGVS